MVIKILLNRMPALISTELYPPPPPPPRSRLSTLCAAALAALIFLPPSGGNAPTLADSSVTYIGGTASYQHPQREANPNATEALHATIIGAMGAWREQPLQKKPANKQANHSGKAIF